jgi:uncharacterized protein (TIGR03437 family)
MPHRSHRLFLIAALAFPLAAQNTLPGWTISTVGGGSYDFWGSRPASEFSFQALSSVAVDSAGNVYIADPYDARVYRMTPDGMMSVFAGSGAHTFGLAPPDVFVPSDDPKKVALGDIRDLVVDSKDNLFILRHHFGPIRINNATHKVETPYHGNEMIDDTFSSNAFNVFPASMAVSDQSEPPVALETLSGGVWYSIGAYLFSPLSATDALFDTDNVYSNPQILAIQNKCLVRVTADGPSKGSAGFTPKVANIACGLGDRMTRDKDGNIYSAYGRNVFKVTSSGNVTKIACVPRIGFQGDCNAASDSDVAFIRDLAVAPNGDIYVVEGGNTSTVPDPFVADPYDPVAAVLWRIRGNSVTPLTGSPFTRGNQSTWQETYLENPWDLAFEQNGDLLVYENDATNGFGQNHASPRAFQLLRFGRSNGPVSTIAGNGQYPFKEGTSTDAQIGGVNGIASDTTGNIFLSIWDSPNRIARVASGGQVTSVVQETPPPSSPFSVLSLMQFHNLAINPDGTFFVGAGVFQSATRAERGGFWALAKVTPPSTITLPDGTLPTTTRLNRLPDAVDALAVDRWGNTFYGGAGCAEHTANGQDVTLAGCENIGQQILRMAVDDLHNIYAVVDNRVIMRTPDNHIYRLAGFAPGTLGGYDDGTGFDGDGGNASAARLSGPTGIAIGPDGALYIGDSGNRRIRKLTREQGPALQIASSDFLDAATGKPATWTVGEIITIPGKKLSLGSIELADSEGTMAFLNLLPNADGSFTAIIPSGFKPGNLRITIVNSDGRGTILETNITGSTVTVASSVSAATYATLPIVAPDSIVACFGKGLATSTVAASDGQPTELNGTEVQITDSAGVSALAPLIFVSDGQIDYVVPGTAALGRATVKIMIKGTTVAVGLIQITRISPGIFTANSDGKSAPAAQVLIVNGDTQTYDLAFEPALPITNVAFVPKPIDLSAGSTYLVLYGTGIRGLHGGTASVTATINGVISVPVIFAGAQSTAAGLDQINIGPFPASLKGAGLVALLITVENQPANTVLLSFK